MEAMATSPTTRRFTSDEVWCMLGIGLLDRDEPYELIDGELVHVSPQDPPHARVISELTQALTFAYGTPFIVRVQLPIGGIAESIPEPDLAVTTAEIGRRDRHPCADESTLIVEVSDTSVRRDIRKGAIYAAAGAPEFWRVEIPRKVVVVHRRPRPDGTWTEVTEVEAGGAFALPGLSQRIEVATFLRPPA